MNTFVYGSIHHVLNLLIQELGNRLLRAKRLIMAQLLIILNAKESLPVQESRNAMKVNVLQPTHTKLCTPNAVSLVETVGTIS